MGIGVTKGTANTTASGTFNIAPPANANGDLAVVIAGKNQGSGSSPEVTSPASTYTDVVDNPDASATTHVLMSYRQSDGSTSNVTVSNMAGGSALIGKVYTASGVDFSGDPVRDFETGNAGVAVNVADLGGTLTGEVGDLVIGVVVFSSTVSSLTVDNGATIDHSGSYYVVFSKVLDSTDATFTVDWATDRTYRYGIVIFKAVAYQASTTDTGNGGTPRVTVTGSQASVTCTANAGTPTASSILSGSQASTTATAQSGSIAVVRPGAQASTTGTAQAGSIVAAVVGERATSTTSAMSGETNALLAGVQASATMSAFAGSAGQDTTVTGVQASSTETSNAGGALIQRLGTQVLSVITAFGGEQTVAVGGSQATTTQSALAGERLTTAVGAQASETITPNGGAAAVTSGGTQVSVTNTAMSGAFIMRITGVMTSESDTANAGTRTASSIISGAQVTVTNTAFAGQVYSAGAITGNQVTVTNTAAPGGAAFTAPGSLASHTTTAFAGDQRLARTGVQVASSHSAFAGSVNATLQGTSASAAHTANAGVTTFAVLGGQASEIASVASGGISATVSGAQSSVASTGVAGGPVLSLPGEQGVVTETAFGLVFRVGTQAATANVAQPGAARVTIAQSAQALESDAASDSLPIITLHGAMAVDATYAHAGSRRVIIPHIIAHATRTITVLYDDRVRVVPFEDRIIR